MLGLPRDIRFGDGANRYLAGRAFANVLPKGIKKNDVANEKRRQDNRLDWMRQLADDAQKGRFERPCPWLDMAGLISSIRRGPPADNIASVKAFARIFVAMRAYEMHARQFGRGIAKSYGNQAAS